MESVFYTLTATAMGDVGIIWKHKNGAPAIIKIYLPVESMKMVDVIKNSFPYVDRKMQRDEEKVSDGILKYLAGNNIEFSVNILDMSLCSEFQKNVLIQTCLIPRGMVSTYGLLAEKLGIPKAPRAIGRALATNPFPLIIPCHRIIRADGDLCGFGGGLKMKKALLSMEGVKFDSRGRVLQKFFW